MGSTEKTDRRVRCSVCGDEFELVKGAPGYPFCSERCRLVDLGRWLDGDYGIPDGESGSAGSGHQDA